MNRSGSLVAAGIAWMALHTWTVPTQAQTPAVSEQAEVRPEVQTEALAARVAALEAAASNTWIRSGDSLPPDLTRGFEFHGYLRSGYGINSEGGKQVAFQAPGAPAKYRLGNEAETYTEVALSQTLHPSERSDPFFSANVRISYSTQESRNDDSGKETFGVREVFAQAGGLSTLPDLSFWAGERFYRRLDIHINDFYVFDMSAYGGGVEGIPVGLGPARLAAAWLGGSSDTYEFPKIGRVAKNTADLRLYDLPVPLGTGMVWLAPSALKGGEYEDADGTNRTYETTVGFAAGLMHERSLRGSGYNRVTAQYGRGTGADFSPVVQSPTPTLDQAWTLRLTQSQVVEPASWFALMWAVIAQVHDTGAAADSRVTWLSGGLRPILGLAPNLALAFEAGADRVASQPDDCTGTLLKATLAPEVRFDNHFLGRPEIRAYATYAAWTDDFKGRVGGTTFADDTAGWSFGVQAEAWW